MSIGALDFWGYDASVVRRYAEFVAWSQAPIRTKPLQDVNFKWADPLFAMFRLGYIFLPQPGNFRVFDVETPPLPHLLLVSKYRVRPNRDAIFEALREPDFDLRSETILESEPEPKPVQSENPGRAQIVDSSTDALTIEADMEPTRHLAHHRCLHAIVGVQLRFPEVFNRITTWQPANYILRAVPLSAGHHRLRVEYFSRAFEIGKWISIVSMFLFGSAIYRFRQG